MRPWSLSWRPSASKPAPKKTAPLHGTTSNAGTGRARYRRRSSLAPATRPPSGCMSHTAHLRTYGSGSKTARCVRASARRTTSPRPTASTDGWSVKRRSCCPPTCHWDITAFTCAPAPTNPPPSSSSPPPGWGCRRGWGRGEPGGWRFSSTACARRGPGGWAIWLTWPIWPSGPAPSTARATCWSTRCTQPPPPRPWNPRPTCRRRGASSTRSISGSRPSRSSRSCPRGGRCAN